MSRYAGASGRITSNFVLSPDGEVSNVQVVVLFIEERRSEMRSVVYPLIALASLVVLGLVGCGGGSDDASNALQPGIYAYELTQEYLVENGISAEQAANESGKHQAILRDDGAFTDSWTTANGGTGSCSGTYDEDGESRVTFKWTTGCFGDWEMTYAVDGDEVTWSDQKALPPYDSDEDQQVNEVFNSVPWTRVGDVS